MGNCTETPQHADTERLDWLAKQKATLYRSETANHLVRVDEIEWEPNDD